MLVVCVMQICLDGYVDGVLCIIVLFVVNVNDKGNVFGGSLVLVLILFGWVLVSLCLCLVGYDVEVYVVDSNLCYLVLVYEDLYVYVEVVEVIGWDVFLNIFWQCCKVCISIIVIQFGVDGWFVVEFSGCFVVFVKGQDGRLMFWGNY